MQKQQNHTLTGEVIDVAVIHDSVLPVLVLLVANVPIRNITVLLRGNGSGGGSGGASAPAGRGGGLRRSAYHAAAHRGHTKHT
jgi:hypothetical protein